jgi:hypothetical protein
MEKPIAQTMRINRALTPAGTRVGSVLVVLGRRWIVRAAGKIMMLSEEPGQAPRTPIDLGAA